MESSIAITTDKKKRKEHWEVFMDKDEWEKQYEIQSTLKIS